MYYGAVTVASIERALELLRRPGSSSALIGLSGGKDSLVTLDLCSRVFSDVQCFFMYVVRGLESIEAPVEAAAKRYGAKLHYVPHFSLGGYLRGGVMRPHLRDTVGWRKTRQVHIEALMRERTGLAWIAYGHRMAESLERRGMLHANSGFDEKGPRLYPIWDWTTADVWAYIRAAKIPPPPQLGRVNQGGVNLKFETLSWFAEHAPADLERIFEMFPYARALFHRARFAEEHAREKGPA